MEMSKWPWSLIKGKAGACCKNKSLAMLVPQVHWPWGYRLFFTIIDAPPPKTKNPVWLGVRRVLLWRHCVLLWWGLVLIFLDIFFLKMAFLLDNSGRKTTTTKTNIEKGLFWRFSSYLFLPNHLIAFASEVRWEDQPPQLGLISIDYHFR